MTDTKMILLGAITLMAVTTSLADKQNAWNLQFSDPNRGGKFLNIPIHYGDWVPITAAKALVEEVANRQRQIPRERVDKRPAPAKEVKEDTPEQESDRRADHGGVHYVDTHNRGYQTNFRHHQQQQRHHVQHHNTNTRRQDAKSIRFSAQNHLNVDASRRNTKKLPPPPPTHFNQIGNNVRTKPVAPPQPQQQSAFPFGFNSFSSFNPFSFFDTGRPSVTTQAPRAAPVTQDKSSTNLNAIRTIAAPDLSKYGPGPPVIELDSGKDGEIILGRPYHVGDGQRDHLAGFVSVDFDGFTPGDREDKKAKLKKQKQQEKEKLAIIVGGKSNAKPRDESDLVNFLNNDKENTETFVFSSDKNPPQGFAKIDLPFMDPTKHHGHLPKAFIAPKGIPIPDGYKGKPLPTQPSVTATTEKVLVHSTQESHNLFRARPSRFQPVNSAERVTQAKPVTSTEKPASLFTSSLLRSKTRNRPSLDDLFRKNIQKAALLDEKNKNSRERTEAYDRTYKINNKVEDARKEFQKESTLSPVIIPVENNFNTFKLVTDNNHEEVAESHNDVIDLDHVISAGEDDNDPISLVFQPEEVLIQSTFEQEKKKEDIESTSVETSTSFAPTVVPTTFAETTTPTAAETTTEEATSSSTTTSTTTTTTTFISTTTTTTTTSTTSSTTTTFEATERAVKYTTQDPFARLESWKKKKKFQFGSKAKYPLDLLTAEDIDETDSSQQPSTEATYNFAQHFRNRQRPWGKNGGRRLRRKKPSRGVFVKKHTSDTLGLFGGIEPTRRPYKPRSRLSSYTTSTKSTTETTEAPDQAQKKKYRPFFDEIYSRLTTEKAETTADTSRRYGLPRRGSRSTTAAPLFTADLLEVYEVDPETGLRVTTRSPTTKSHDLHFSRTTTQLKSIEPVDSDTDYYTYQDDYVYEPTTSQAPVTKEEPEVTTEQIQEYVPTVQTIVKTVTETAKTTEEPSTVSTVTEDTEEIHETADKHSTTTLPSVETTFSFDDTVVDVDRIDLDIHNEISDQLVEESQRVETTWNGVINAEDHTQANTRLSSYEKNVDTSIYGADTEYNVSGLEPQVNEHSKPTVTGSEHSEADGDNQSGDTWPSQPKVREYLEIDRSEPIARVEEVPITESRDYSEPDIIYDVTKDGFDDDVDTFSVPVAVAFNVPETETPVVIQTSTVSQEVTTSDVIETETSTAPVIETTTLRETVPTTTAEEIQSSTTTTAEEQSTTTFAEEVTTTASPTTEKPESTFNKFYNLIHRNRNNRLEQVYLGSRPTTTVRTTTSTAPTTQIIDLTKSAHKVPNSVWSHFERSREDRTTTRAPAVIVVEEENTTTMSYNNTNNAHVVADLPKPSLHESEVLVEKQVLNTEEASYSGFVPRRKTNKEKWRKSLLASKKKYNKPKFPRVPLLPFAPSHQKNQYHPETTSQTLTTKEVSTEDRNEIVDEVAREPSLFAPTMPPKEDNKEESNSRPLLDNIYSSTSRRKVNTSLFQKPEISTESKTSKTPRVFGVPRGSRTDLFRSYGAASLSQADFERQILGVSTATEISVKSMICVKGRCYNADESGRLKQN